MVKLNIAVIYGGCSPEHLVSRSSANAIISNLSQEKYEIIPIYINKEGSWIMYDNCSNPNEFNWERIGVEVVLSSSKSHKGLIRIVRDRANVIPIDIIFPVLHGPNGEDGTIQGLFEISGIPYVGCGVLASSVCMDKSVMKLIAKDLNIPQAEYLIYHKHEDLKKLTTNIKSKLGYPCFVKPCNGGSSIGMSRVETKKDLQNAIELALHYDNKVVIEKAIVGREIEVSVLGTPNDLQISIPGEIKPCNIFYDYKAKYIDEGSELIIPAELSDDAIAKIHDISRKMFTAINGCGLSRIDFFVTDSSDVIFNEINTMPGFTEISMYPKLWEYSGLKFPQLLDKLIQLSLESNEAKAKDVWTIEQ